MVCDELQITQETVSSSLQEITIINIIIVANIFFNAVALFYNNVILIF